jgi:ElaB/YqjD/DUF883 family membrane-anchored ribosome-binding protein
MSVETPPMTTKPRKATPTANGAAEAVEAAETRLADAARRAEAAIREGVETLRAQTRAYADTAAERLDNAQRAVVEQVREKPVASALTAFGVGLVLGVLLAGRRN